LSRNTESSRADRARGRAPARRTPMTLPVAREEITVGKRTVPIANVRVKKIVRERVATVDEPVVREDVVVTRVPLDRPVTEPIPPRQEGDTLVLSVVEEVFVKQLRLIEEVRITKRRRVTRRTTTMPLRREEVVVERTVPTADKERPHGQDDRRNI
jgi:stress response protein YsnF